MDQDPRQPDAKMFLPELLSQYWPHENVTGIQDIPYAVDDE